MASTDVRLTKEQVRKSKQDACKEIGCARPGMCPYCCRLKEVSK
jgi:hypothetical protein